MSRALLRSVLRSAGIASAATFAFTANQYRIVMTCYKPLPEPEGPTTGIAAPSTASKPRPSCRVVFVGDSLVMGVGSSRKSWAEGPPLPKRAAELIASRKSSAKESVRWSSFAVNGGDVRTLRRQLMPQIRRESATLGASEPVAAVVIVCGLNDWKHMLVDFRTPSVFRRDLAQLIAEIRAELGADVRVVLPGLPSVAGAPFLGRHFPLRWCIDQVALAWDRQKILLAESIDGVEFVETGEFSFIYRYILRESCSQFDSLPLTSLTIPLFVETVSFTEISASGGASDGPRRGGGGGGALNEDEGRPPYATDGLHPNEWGYGLWAEQIVSKVQWE